MKEVFVTEEEAKEKHCPLARVVGIYTAGTYNRWRVSGSNGDGVFENVKCLASECMLWGWDRAGKGYCGLNRMFGG